MKLHHEALSLQSKATPCTYLKVINAWRMRESYSCLFVRVCVCYQSSASVRHVCNKLNLPVESLLNFQGFQLTDFAKMLFFSQVINCFSFLRSQVGRLQFIEVVTWQVCLTTFTYEC